MGGREAGPVSAVSQGPVLPGGPQFLAAGTSPRASVGVLRMQRRLPGVQGASRRLQGPSLRSRTLSPTSHCVCEKHLATSSPYSRGSSEALPSGGTSARRCVPLFCSRATRAWPPSPKRSSSPNPPVEGQKPRGRAWEETLMTEFPAGGPGPELPDGAFSWVTAALAAVFPQGCIVLYITIIENDYNLA